MIAYFSFSRPVSSEMAMLPLRDMATKSPSLFFTVLRARYFTVPAFLASSTVCSTTLLAVPPIWKVRMVSWVPGSPMDCAAMMPIASPISTSLPRARSRP